MKKDLIGWVSATAFGIAGTVNLFSIGPVISTVGGFGILLFIVGMLLALVSGYGWLQVVLRHSDKVGGATINCYEVFKSRSPLVLTLLCFANWAAWVIMVGLVPVWCASAFAQWFPIGTLSLTTIAIGLVFVLVGIGLCRLTTIAKIIVPLATISVAMLLLSVILPLTFGHPAITPSMLLEIKTPFAGWFGYLTAIMMGFYQVGWIVLAYEVSTWLCGEMIDAKKTVTRAFIISALISCLNFFIIPWVWVGTIGSERIVSDYTANNNFFIFKDLFPGFGETTASVMAFLLIMCYLLTAGIGAMVGQSRLLVQLAEYGLIPRIYQQRLANGAPWAAVISAGFCAIPIVWYNFPVWLIAATNFGYLAAMVAASYGSWLLSKRIPLNKLLINAGLVCSSIWLMSILLGFHQYGMISMLNGIGFVLLGVFPYAYRKISDLKPRRFNYHSIHLSLPLMFLILMLLNSIGYLIMLLQLPTQQSPLTSFLQDIFVTVVLLTITLGLWITESVAYVAEVMAKASKHLAEVTMPAMVDGMKALGSGNLQMRFAKPPSPSNLEIDRKDELGVMISSFAKLEAQISNLFMHMQSTREQLLYSHEQIEEAQQDLVEIAHQAGKAEVATNVLHNVGNILNSVKTTAFLLHEKVNKSDLNALKNISKLVSDNQDSFNKILGSNKGSHLARYIEKLDEYWGLEQKELLSEVSALIENIEHINEIISTQQSLSRLVAVEQQVDMKKVVEDVLRISAIDFEPSGIKIEIHCSVTYAVIVNRIKLMQILVNLIRNARDALLESTNQDKKITINITSNGDKIRIEVTDTGIGIKKESLPSIFKHGFTTKKTGHGFGLHSCALSANEMQGTLRVESKGVNQGATFILEIPLVKSTALDEELV